MSRPQIQTLHISKRKTNYFNFNFTVSIISLKSFVHLIFKKKFKCNYFYFETEQMMAELDTRL